ncbi:hypothetical protein AKJ57_03090 [candidate division MSBL1 archaeon SCGC-AAA259A05]|uniref:Uncharacterized protein n=1 Tax=candidate division MSBL1 archaeon SCGC-AAA259A05 TaxID=1698259 RepID=A0A133U9X4_9EURY|nr:hypothetical protein AKJ57_03090 [candidate division MSBL1 archaeon SCGC-AAA259A05]
MGIDSVDDHLAMIEALNDPINATGKMDESKFEKGPGQFLEGGDRGGEEDLHGRSLHFGVTGIQTLTLLDMFRSVNILLVDTSKINMVWDVR